MRRPPSPRSGELVLSRVTLDQAANQAHLDLPRRDRMPSGGGEAWHEDWRAEAACVGEDLDIFFPLGDQATHHALSNRAKQVCGRCPVLDTCRAWALRTSPEFGIFGGLTAHERRLVREGRWSGQGPHRTSRDTTRAPGREAARNDTAA